MVSPHLESTPPRFGGDILIKIQCLERSAKPFPDSDRAKVHFLGPGSRCVRASPGGASRGGGSQGGPAGRQATDMENVFAALKKHPPAFWGRRFNQKLISRAFCKTVSGF